MSLSEILILPGQAYLSFVVNSKTLQIAKHQKNQGFGANYQKSAFLVNPRL